MSAKLTLRKGQSDKAVINLEHKTIKIGCYPDCDLIVEKDKFISGIHALIICSDEHYFIQDNNSTNGTFVNGKRINRQKLQSGDIITIGDAEFEFASSSTSSSTGKITIGRNPESNIYLNHVQVSWRHAAVYSSPEGKFFIHDNNSINGLYVNGIKIEKQELHKGDIIEISKFKLLFDGTHVKNLCEEGRLRLDALGLTRTVSEGKTILNDISLSIHPCEFVAIVGTSGAGKSTLLKTLSGVYPKDRGDVFINGENFYEKMDFFRNRLGYVPQDDIVHEELDVYKALYYAASLRLPEDTKKEEIDNIIDLVLKEIELEERKYTQIRKLSGGQRKRVSIGVELLTKPDLFFLDEPTSGLDPATETRMMSLLRKLADQGRTIILVTHVTKNVKFCDRIIFLARGGYLVFFGSPQEAFSYFQVNDFTEIYNLIETQGSPKEWAEKFKMSSCYKEGLLERLKETDMLHSRKTHILSHMKELPHRGASSIRQFFILSSRYYEIMLKDIKNLAIVLLQAPIIAILLALVFKRDIFNDDPKIGDGNAALTLIFFLICVSVWFGTSNAAREIIKEHVIYERERMINLQVIPYVLSKFVILSLICLVQCAILLGIVVIGVKFPDNGRYDFYADVYCCIFLTSLTGVGMGLLVSSIVSTVDKATSIVPILLIPQLIFSGAIIPFKNMDKFSKFISNFIVSRWSVGLLGSIVDLNDKLPEHMKNLLKETFDINIRKHFNVLSCLFTIFLILTCFFQKRKDVK
jgi:ABC-type multidrug transport system ATPase subunit